MRAEDIMEEKSEAVAHAVVGKTEIARRGRGEVAHAEKQADFNEERRSESDHARGQFFPGQSFPADKKYPQREHDGRQGPEQVHEARRKVRAQIAAKNVLGIVDEPGNKGNKDEHAQGQKNDSPQFVSGIGFPSR